MRKTITIRISAPGRDEGKHFVLREMPAMQAEKWAVRALAGMGRSDVDIPENLKSMGMVGIAILGLKALSTMNFEELEPLMDEMISCVQCMPDALRPEIIRGLMDGDIEEVSTLVNLRKELITLHTGFSFPADSQKSTTASAGTDQPA